MSEFVSPIGTQEANRAADVTGKHVCKRIVCLSLPDGAHFRMVAKASDKLSE